MNPKLTSFLVAFLSPMLIGKTFVLYFGIKFSSEGGSFYLWGLLISIGFTLFMFGRFIYKFKDIEDL